MLMREGDEIKAIKVMILHYCVAEIFKNVGQ